ncbi:sensor histidine kinase [Planomonospora venezuelensis]|uniref:histidine kinase n=1 Tax=Planomonospora venezuelensis TaxID=1999 RepID=A0A841DG01_PLAVE|nr:histidine kinase [Planomonospora venezuelensis]MBB5967015.1 signal transduction histidine kinase [Planomonospora venezuelensis]
MRLRDPAPEGRTRGPALDVFLALAGVAFGLFVSGKTGHPVSWPATLALAAAAGIPMGLVWRWPLAVCVYQSAFLVVCDHFSNSTTDTVQTLTPIAVGVLAYRCDWRQVVPGAALAAGATAVNLADPGLALTASTWYFPLGMSAVPVVVGRYLRSPIEAVAKVERRPGLDLLLSGGGVAFMVLDTWADWHDGPWPVWGVGWFVIGCGLTAGLARMLPGTAFALQAVLVLVADQYAGFAANSLQGLFLVTLGAFAMRASWSWTAVAYLLAAGVTALNVVEEEWAEVTPARVAALLAMVAAPIIIGRYFGVRRDAADLQLAMAEEARQLAAERARADLLAERERIARDVHDIVAHHVGAMVLRAGAAQYAAPSGPVAEALSDIRTTGHQVLEDLRGLLNVLRDPELAHLPVAAPEEVVRDAVERMNAAGLRVELRSGPEAGLVPLVTRASAARIVQEGLTNVLKHAGPGTAAVVELKVTGEALEVIVTSGPAPEEAPGPGLLPPGPRDALPSSGQGIAGMRERARALGGDLSAAPDGAGGWRLAATLPLERDGGSCGMTPQRRILPWRREEGREEGRVDGMGDHDGAAGPRQAERLR